MLLQLRLNDIWFSANIAPWRS